MAYNNRGPRGGGGNNPRQPQSRFDVFKFEPVPTGTTFTQPVVVKLSEGNQNGRGSVQPYLGPDPYGTALPLVEGQVKVDFTGLQPSKTYQLWFRHVSTPLTSRMEDGLVTMPPLPTATAPAAKPVKKRIQVIPNHNHSGKNELYINAYDENGNPLANEQVRVFVIGEVSTPIAVIPLDGTGFVAHIIQRTSDAKALVQAVSFDAKEEPVDLHGPVPGQEPPVPTQPPTPANTAREWFRYGYLGGTDAAQLSINPLLNWIVPIGLIILTILYLFGLELLFFSPVLGFILITLAAIATYFTRYLAVRNSSGGWDACTPQQKAYVAGRCIGHVWRSNNRRANLFGVIFLVHLAFWALNGFSLGDPLLQSEIQEKFGKATETTNMGDSNDFIHQQWSKYGLINKPAEPEHHSRFWFAWTTFWFFFASIYFFISRRDELSLAAEKIEDAISRRKMVTTSAAETAATTAAVTAAKEVAKKVAQPESETSKLMAHLIPGIVVDATRALIDAFKKGRRH